MRVWGRNDTMSVARVEAARRSERALPPFGLKGRMPAGGRDFFSTVICVGCGRALSAGQLSSLAPHAPRLLARPLRNDRSPSAGPINTSTQKPTPRPPQPSVAWPECVHAVHRPSDRRGQRRHLGGTGHPLHRGYGRLVPAEEDAGSEASECELRERREREEERRAEGEEQPLFFPRPCSWHPRKRTRGRSRFPLFCLISVSCVVSLVHISSCWFRPGRRAKRSLQRAASGREAGSVRSSSRSI